MEVVTISTPAIIEKEQFELSLQKLAERTKRSNSFGTKYNPLLRGLIHCPHCDVKYDIILEQTNISALTSTRRRVTKMYIVQPNVFPISWILLFGM